MIAARAFHNGVQADTNDSLFGIYAPWVHQANRSITPDLELATGLDLRLPPATPSNKLQSNLALETSIPMKNIN